MVSLNVQIYFHKAGITASKLPATLKKKAFLKGVLSDMPDTESFKKFVIQYGLFDIHNINGTTFVRDDGVSRPATFIPTIHQSELPDGEVFCGLLITNGLPIDEERVHYLLQLKPDEIVGIDEGHKTTTVNKDVLDAIRVLINLYGTVAEKILDDIGDTEIGAVETLERYLNQVQL